MLQLYLVGTTGILTLSIGHPGPLTNCARLDCISRGRKKKKISQKNVKQKITITSQY